MTYRFNGVKMGAPDLNLVTTIAPGTANLPGVVLSPQLGEVCDGWDTSLGSGKFIYLKVPTSTALAAGILVQWDKNYQITTVPAKSSSKNTGVAVAACVNAVSSNASSVQYTWFQIQGVAPVLKTAVAVAPQSALYISTTAGRVYTTSSAGGQILGARSANTATVTSTTSTINVYLNYSALEGA